MFGALIKSRVLSKKDIRLRVSFFYGIFNLSLQQIPINPYGKHITGNIFPAVFDCPFYRERYSAAAGNFHAGYRYGADGIFTQDFRQLIGVIGVV